MQIQVRLDRTALRRWHLDIVRALHANDVAVTVRWSASSHPVPRDVERLLAVERWLHRLPPGRSARVGAEAFERYVYRAGDPDPDPDLVLDLAGEAGTTASATWRLTFDGEPGEMSAIAALLSGRFPVVEVV